MINHVCKELCNRRGQHQQLRRNTTNKQARGTHESSVVGLVSVHMLQVCDHIKHVGVFVALHSCHHFTCCQLFPHIHFSTVCEFLADCVDSHTAKTGLLRCCLYTHRRLQQTAVSCKRSNCNQIENNKINS